MNEYEMTDEDFEYAMDEAAEAERAAAEEEYYEPSEYDEWMDFDPDC